MKGQSVLADSERLNESCVSYCFSLFCMICSPGTHWTVYRADCRTARLPDQTKEPKEVQDSSFSSLFSNTDNNGTSNEILGHACMVTTLNTSGIQLMTGI